MKHLTPTKTQQFLHAVPEALFVGHPLDAEHVSWSDGLPWEQS